MNWKKAQNFWIAFAVWMLVIDLFALAMWMLAAVAVRFGVWQTVILVIVLSFVAVMSKLYADDQIYTEWRLE